MEEATKKGTRICNNRQSYVMIRTIFVSEESSETVQNLIGATMQEGFTHHGGVGNATKPLFGQRRDVIGLELETDECGNHEFVPLVSKLHKEELDDLFFKRVRTHVIQPLRGILQESFKERKLAGIKTTSRWTVNPQLIILPQLRNVRETLLLCRGQNLERCQWMYQVCCIC